MGNTFIRSERRVNVVNVMNVIRGAGRWEIYGLGLPDSILEKVYHLNAERIFGQFKDPSATTSRVLNR